MFTFVLVSTYNRGNLDEDWMNAIKSEIVWAFEHGDTSILLLITILISLVTRVMTLFSVAGLL